MKNFGEEIVVLVMFFFFCQVYRLLLISEPDSYINPGIQHRLIKFFHAYRKKVASCGFPRDGKNDMKVITGMILWDHSEN